MEQYPDSDEQESSGIRWAEIVGLVVRRWRIVLAVFGGGLAIAVVQSFLQGPVYVAGAKLMVSAERARMAMSPDPHSGLVIDNVTPEDLNSQVALLQSPSLVREFLEEHQSQAHAAVAAQPPPGFLDHLQRIVRYPLRLPGRLYRSIHGIEPYGPLDEWVADTAEGLSVSTIRNSTLIEVTYASADPHWAAEVVNGLIRQHVKRQAQLNRQSEARRFFETQRELLSERLRQAEDRLRAFYAREGLDTAPEQLTLLRERVAKLEAALQSANLKLAEAEARSRFLTDALRSEPKTLPSEAHAGPAGPQQLLRSRILELQLQRSQLLSQYAPGSSRVQDIDRQIAEAQSLLDGEVRSVGGVVGPVNPTRQTLDVDLAQTQAQIAAVRARATSLQEQIAEQRAKLDHLDAITAEQESLTQEVTSAKEGYLTYLKKEEEARFTDALDKSHILNVSVVEEAVVPTIPEPSQRTRTVLLGTVLGLALGFGLAFLRDRFDPAVKSVTEAGRIAGLPVLANIPP